MLADQPNLPDTRTQGDELRRLEIWTLATLSPKRFLIQSQVWPNSCFISFSFSSFLSPTKSSNYFSLNWPKWKPKILPLNDRTINSFHISSMVVIDNFIRSILFTTINQSLLLIIHVFWWTRWLIKHDNLQLWTKVPLIQLKESFFFFGFLISIYERSKCLLPCKN